jgi:hypothetical protein
LSGVNRLKTERQLAAIDKDMTEMAEKLDGLGA